MTNSNYNFVDDNNNVRVYIVSDIIVILIKNAIKKTLKRRRSKIKVKFHIT